MEVEMYNEVAWMKPADWAIIQLLNRDLELTPANIARNTGYSRDWSRQRAREMVERGILVVDENGNPFFSLTEFGRRVADRELTGDEVEEETLLPKEREDEDE